MGVGVHVNTPGDARHVTRHERWVKSRAEIVRAQRAVRASGRGVKRRWKIKSGRKEERVGEWGN